MCVHRLELARRGDRDEMARLYQLEIIKLRMQEMSKIDRDVSDGMLRGE